MITTKVAGYSHWDTPGESSQGEKGDKRLRFNIYDPREKNKCKK